jgi:hypothetical protein
MQRFDKILEGNAETNGMMKVFLMLELKRMIWRQERPQGEESRRLGGNHGAWRQQKLELPVSMKIESESEPMDLAGFARIRVGLGYIRR